MTGASAKPEIAIRIESPAKSEVQALISQSNGIAPFEALNAPNAELLVARMDDRPVGWVALIDQLRYGEVLGLVVDETVKGSGVRSALIGALEAAARDVGLQRLAVSADGIGDTVSSTFSQLGFAPAPAGVLEKYL